MPTPRRAPILRPIVPLASYARAAAALALAFGLFGLLVGGGHTCALDRELLVALRAGPGLEPVARGVTRLGDGPVLGVLGAAAFVFALARREPLVALWLAGVFVGSQILHEALKLGFARPRPDLVPQGVSVDSPAFPSGHALLAGVFYPVLVLVSTRVPRAARARRPLLVLAALLALAVGTTRVLLGVHWPSDVLGGWLVAGAWLCAARPFLPEGPPTPRPRQAAPRAGEADARAGLGGSEAERLDRDHLDLRRARGELDRRPVARV